MTQIWPITVTLLAPNWVDGLLIPDQPTIITTFASRSESRLRISSVPTSAEMTAWFNPIAYPAVTALTNFYQLVGTFEDFTLPSGSPNFFAAGCPADREAMYRAASPTGRWRFKSPPVLNEIELRMQQAVCTLVSSID